MNVWPYTLAFAASLTLSGAKANEKQSTDNKEGFWPNGAQAAISLAYDDALPSHLDHAIPALNRFELVGSFYLVLGADSITHRLPEWRSAAKRGHELGNHSLFHPCSGSKPNRDWVNPDNDLDHLSAKQVQQQVLLANSFLHAIDGESTRTYTLPCTDNQASGENYVRAIDHAFVGIKYQVGNIPDSARSIDEMRSSIIDPAGLSATDLIAIAEQAADKGSLASYTFHGIGADHLAVSVDAHNALLSYLAAHPESFGSPHTAISAYT